MKHTTDPADKENLRTGLDAMRVSIYITHYLQFMTFKHLLTRLCVCLQDLAQCVNEVKRDNEIIRQITTFQLSIENMVRFHMFPSELLHLVCLHWSSSSLCSALQTQSLALFGRPKIDGELKICTPEKKSKQDRCVLFMSW